VAGDWAERWREFHRPVRIGSLWVGPTWERDRPQDALAVVIDPGQAFGTGAHPTTRLCLELLLEQQPSSVLDVGCGSGVLAICAAKLGFAPVIAVDREEAALEAARANSSINEVAVDVRQLDVLAAELPEAMLALANLELSLIPAVCDRFPGAKTIASGYLARDHPHVPGWRAVARRDAEGWAADLLERA
jgi:ribosomal protein L11 methyltransferase